MSEQIVNKKDLIHWVNTKIKSMSEPEIEKGVEAFFKEISTALICGDRVELRGFGSMVVRRRKSNIARNPRTNEKIKIDNKGSLYFRASKELVNTLNKKS